jgi:hypothetical protein
MTSAEDAVKERFEGHVISTTNADWYDNKGALASFPRYNEMLAHYIAWI